MQSCESDLDFEAGVPLNPEQMNVLVQETLMSALVATDGLVKAKHLSYDPSKRPELTAERVLKDNMLPLDNARTLRGRGPWVSEVKTNYQLAYETGLVK
ncbi:hypothetical protein BN59_01447 [Legionella massiliensis]|uniref:Uncharacterized protein n=1 Tax=Legionella massiliensis TaxID=1034943 RepID=A0A078KRU4_9GAMM|nr:hypothetical protein [Legionella massiliensis]CDZ77165.1 hypothetical protein BN59_01447 [Legionella massiliensis]CEE12903.1 hypothetical protein BN1094_01447 [Legionella massiliensis]